MSKNKSESIGSRTEKISKNKVRLMFADPLYCLLHVQGWHIESEKPMITKQQWKACAKIAIKEGGIDQWLDDLLYNLEGNFKDEN